MKMNPTKIEHWINLKDKSIHLPTAQLINRLKEIPTIENSNNESLSNWISWLAAASFVGIMLLNLNYLNTNSAEDSILESYFSTTINYGS